MQFTDSSTATAPATVAAWQWSFGDNGTSNTQNPAHTYAAAGAFSVKLKAVSSKGCFDSLSRQVTVYALPNGTFTASKGQKRDYSFTATDGTQTKYDWNYGDNTTGSGASSTHTYAANGSYVVSLKVTNANGCEKTTTQTMTVNYTGITETAVSVQNLNLYPSPFSTQFTISYDLAKETHVKIDVLDITGRYIASVANGMQVNGKHSYTLNAADYQMNGGMYMIRMVADGVVINKGLIQAGE
jgi:PKD repeat protein